jgi:hypothetical protein
MKIFTISISVKDKFCKTERTNNLRQPGESKEVTDGFNSIQKIVAAQPKDVLHEKRILFFPEWNQKEYYKIIFGRVLFWVLWVIVVTYCYFLGQDFLARN